MFIFLIAVLTESVCATNRLSELQLVITLAGTPISGDLDGPADTAMFDYPHGIAIDEFNNIIIADTYSSKIRMFCKDTGNVTTIAGADESGFLDGSANESQFLNPRGVTVDPTTGSIVVTDTDNHRVPGVCGLAGS